MKKKLWALLLMVCLAAVLLAVTAFAANDYTVGNWTYTIDNGTAYIKSYNGSASSVTLPTNPKINGATYKIVTVGDYAFEGNIYLESVTIPQQYTKLGKGAFKNCTNLSSVTINGNLGDSFEYSTWNGDDSSYSVFYGAGANTSSMTLTFGPSVTRVPAYLCGTGHEKSENVYAHFTKVVIPASVQEIGKCAFSRCYDLKTISFADGAQVTEFGNYAFEYCSSIASMKFPSKVATIGEYCFMNCYGLKTVVIPKSTTKLSKGAFKNCTNLSSITINGNLGDCFEYSSWNGDDSSYAVFYGAGANTSAMTLTFGNSVTRIPAYLFATGHDRSENVYAHITKVVIPASVQEIGKCAFSRCYDLKTISFADGAQVTEFGNYAFESCYSIISMNIPAKVATIGEFCFINCSGLKTVVIPKSTTKLSKGAFKNCTNLSSVTINGNLGDCFEYSSWNGDDSSYAVFYGAGANTSAMTLTFGNSVTQIPAYLFATGHDRSENVYAHFTKVTIPASVKQIGRAAFHNCYDLKSVTYGGSKAKWNAINIAEGNEKLTSASITYTATAITSNPSSKYAKAGTNVTFSAKASGSGLSYQWQYKAPNGTWKACTATGCKTASLTVSVTVAKNNYQYRCKVTDAAGNKLNSKAATLTVFGIKTQPTNKSVTNTNKATFKVTAIGKDLTYQWQYKAPGGTWKNSSRSGNKTAALTLQGVSGTANRNGYQFRCKITDSKGNTVTSAAAKLTVFAIKTQPKAVNTTSGKTVTFKVVATGSNLKYQWQYKSPSGTWKNSTLSGNDTAALKVKATESRNGYQYRCKVTSGSAKLTSKAVKLTVTTITITTQPTSVTKTAGKTATFKVAATGSNLKYQWQYRSPDGDWKLSNSSGNTTPTLTVNVTSKLNGYQFRCIISSGTASVKSNVAMLTVN